jgi:hypothetical protein
MTTPEKLRVVYDCNVLLVAAAKEKSKEQVMPAKDIYHNAVRQALINDGWTITDDPYKIEWRKKKVYVDLGAERLLTAEKAGEKIEDALGQFELYQILLEETEPARRLYLAIHEIAFDAVFKDKDSIGHLLVEKKRIQLIVFDPQREEILQWITEF